MKSEATKNKIPSKSDYIICDVDDLPTAPDFHPRGGWSVVPTAPINDIPTTHEEESKIKLEDSSNYAEEGENKDGKEVENEGGKGGEWDSRSKGAGILCCLLSTLCFGPIIGCVFGLGTSCTAAKSAEGTIAGDTARAIGDVAMTVHDKAQHINQKHHIVTRTKHGASDVWDKAKEYERRNRVKERSLEAMKDTGSRIRDFDDKYNVTERAFNKLSRGFASVSHIMNGKKHNDETTSLPLVATTGLEVENNGNESTLPNLNDKGEYV